jgi:hypothetical protein
MKEHKLMMSWKKEPRRIFGAKRKPVIEAGKIA